jgi:TetR/AcrR family transcriptional repressor of mexJK operon
MVQKKMRRKLSVETKISNFVGRPKDLVKREAIMVAARDLFLSKSYEGVSMAAIAAVAGVSKLTLYSHFADKAALFQEVISAKCQEHTNEKIYQDAGRLPIRQALQMIGEAFVHLVFSDDAICLYRMMMQNAPGQAAINQLFYEAGPQQICSHIASLLATLAPANALVMADPRKAASHFIFLLKGEWHYALSLQLIPTAPDTEVLRQHVADCVDLLLRAYGVEAV